MKVAEARVLESELNRLREENLDLKKQAGEVAVVEEKLRKSEARAETLEEKVSVSCLFNAFIAPGLTIFCIDG